MRSLKKCNMDMFRGSIHIYKYSHMPVLLCKVSTNTNIHMKFHQNKNNGDPADYCRKEDDTFKHIRDPDLDRL